MKKLNAVFVGCANISAACLDELLLQDSIQLDAIFTANKDSIVKRQISDVGVFDTLVKNQCEVIKISPEEINGAQCIKKIQQLQPDILFCIGWPILIKKEILEIPRYALGMHPSKLPKNRGQAPIPWSIIRGQTSSAVTCFRLEERADSGEIYAQRSFKIKQDADATDIYKIYAALGRQIISEVLNKLISDTLTGRLQDESEATYTRKRIPQDGFIDWAQPTKNIYALVRALTYPYYPGAFTYINDERLTELKIWIAEPFAPKDKYSGSPGQIVAIRNGCPIVRTGDGTLLIKKVGIPNKNIFDAADFDFKINDRLGISQAHIASIISNFKGS